MGVLDQIVKSKVRLDAIKLINKSDDAAKHGQKKSF